MAPVGAEPNKSDQSTPRTRKVQLRKGLVRYYYVVIAANGKITETGQKYYSKATAVRAAKKTAKLYKAKYTERAY